ncbi:TatD related DNase [Musa troglodytarum]|uniref:TatD related DNase n=1 Tax=Musa troglodytarum TaxID=320322 RepID=A0A9E7L7R8_9LILI|nr:TatD related DNase [Musa troglodytarum]
MSSTVRMIDIAVNFTDLMFKGIYNGRQCHAADIPAVLARAWSAGVDRIIVTGGSLQESKEALAIAETDGRLFCTVGVHPTRCKVEFEESGDPEQHFQALVSLAQEGIQKGKVVAIGECGLDYDRLQFCPADIQMKQVLDVVAGSKGIGDLERLSKVLYHNTCRVFFPSDLDTAADALLESGHNVQ